MKTTLICLPLLAIVLVPPRAGAQDAGARFGIGVSLNPSVVVAGDIESFFLPFGLGDVYVPIMIGERLKLEPQLGLFRFSSKFSDSGFTSESTFTVWRLGTGIFYRLPASESFSAYLGPRFELLLSSRSADFSGGGGADESKTDVAIGAALGGEYFFSSHFSLGGEFQLNYVNLGEFDGEAPAGSESSETIISNNGLILIRWYF